LFAWTLSSKFRNFKVGKSALIATQSSGPRLHPRARVAPTMADRLARVYGTEDDKVNCSYYHKTGACRHGAACGRKHNAPLLSQTLLLKHLWANPAAMLEGGRATADAAAALQRGFEDMLIDVFDEMSRFGEVEEVHVCDNLCDHMVRQGGRGGARGGRASRGRGAVPSPTPSPSPPLRRSATCT